MLITTFNDRLGRLPLELAMIPVLIIWNAAKDTVIVRIGFPACDALNPTLLYLLPILFCSI